MHTLTANREFPKEFLPAVFSCGLSVQIKRLSGTHGLAGPGYHHDPSHYSHQPHPALFVVITPGHDHHRAGGQRHEGGEAAQPRPDLHHQLPEL